VAELEDYSGPFKPDLKLEDFSKPVLIRLLQAACKDYLGIAGIWLTFMRQKYGDEVSFGHDVEVWEPGTMMDTRRLRQALNMWGDDVASVMKYIQTAPSMGSLLEIECEMIDENHGRYTITHCQGLDYCERHDDEALVKHQCEGLCIPYNQRTAEWFNPKIKWTAIKLPPRKSKDEPACVWDITLEE